MKKENWIWMPHPGHFCLRNKCRFSLNTYIGKYIVSTVGELWQDREIRNLQAKIHDIKWYKKNKSSSDYDELFMKKFGYQDFAYGEKYETKVFKAKRSGNKCCPFLIKGKELDSQTYNSDEDARKGHIKVCNKWNKK